MLCDLGDFFFNFGIFADFLGISDFFNAFNLWILFIMRFCHFWNFLHLSITTTFRIFKTFSMDFYVVRSFVNLSFLPLSISCIFFLRILEFVISHNFTDFLTQLDCSTVLEL